MTAKFVSQLSALLAAATPVPWSQGRLLNTPTTERWDADRRQEAHELERLMVFAHFTAADQGRSRELLAKCESAALAALITFLANHASAIARVAKWSDELLRLYDWRAELGKLESQMACEAHSAEAAEQMRKDLLKYGREKKTAWAELRAALAEIGG